MEKLLFKLGEMRGTGKHFQGALIKTRLTSPYQKNLAIFASNKFVLIQ